MYRLSRLRYGSRRPAFASFTGVGFDSTLGFPGEGPKIRRGSNNGNRQEGGLFTSPSTQQSTPPSGTRKKLRFTYTLGWLLATLMPGTLAAGVDHLDQLGCERVVERLCFHNRQARFWRGKFDGKSTADAPG